MAIDLAKHTFYVLDRKHTDYGRGNEKVTYTVAYVQTDRKGTRAKVGELSIPFRKAYGIDVIATWDGEIAWGAVTTERLNVMKELLETGQVSKHTILDTSYIQ